MEEYTPITRSDYEAIMLRTLPVFNEQDYKNYIKGYPCKYEYNKSYLYHWRQRLHCEMKASTTAYFVTLTFDEVNIMRFFPESCKRKYFTDEPIFPDNYLFYPDNKPFSEFEKAELKKKYYNRCFDLFIRRFRITLDRLYPDYGRERFKFFAMSEPGDLFGRFHFHVIMYNVPICNSVHPFKDILFDTWKYGFVEVENMRKTGTKKINYITKYMFKRFSDPLFFSRKSNSIGMAYFDDAKKKYMLDNLTTRFHIDGREYFLGRFFQKKMFPEDIRQEMLRQHAIEEAEVTFNSMLTFAMTERRLGLVVDIPTKTIIDKDGLILSNHECYEYLRPYYRIAEYVDLQIRKDQDWQRDETRLRLKLLNKLAKQKIDYDTYQKLRRYHSSTF